MLQLVQRRIQRPGNNAAMNLQVDSKPAHSTVGENNQLYFQGVKFVCMSMDKNHLHYHQLSTAYGVIKIALSVKGTEA